MIVLRGCITELYDRIVSQDYITELYYRIVAELYYGMLLQNHIMVWYYGIIVRTHRYEKDPRDARDVIGAPWDSGDPMSTPLGPPRGRPWDPRAHTWDTQGRP